MNMPIKEWPNEERPRERLLTMGPDYLSDAELLAIIIGSGSSASGMNAIETARALLKEHESLEKLSALAPPEFMKTKGIGPSKASKLCAIFEISKRIHTRKPHPGARIHSSKDAYEFLNGKMNNMKKELFFTLLLNGKNSIIRSEVISVGSLTSSVVHPREAFLPAIKHSAAAVIFAHNHPSGDPTPSPEDKLITRRLYESGEILGIRVLDHIIVGFKSYYSFADNNELRYNGKKMQEG